VENGIMIKMTYSTLSDYNTSEGMHVLFQYVAETVPVFIPLVLFAVFVIVSFGTYFSQRRLSGRGDFIISFAVAGYITVLVAYVMSLIDGLINNFTVIICVVIAVLGTLMLFVSPKKPS